MAVVIPICVAFVLGYFTFKNRIRGAFFDILSQATVMITVTLFVGHQGYTGGTNGLTNFTTFLDLSLKAPSTKYLLFYLTLVTLGVILVSCSLIFGPFYLVRCSLSLFSFFPKGS